MKEGTSLPGRGAAGCLVTRCSCTGQAQHWCPARWVHTRQSPRQLCPDPGSAQRIKQPSTDLGGCGALAGLRLLPQSLPVCLGRRCRRGCAACSMAALVSSGTPEQLGQQAVQTCRERRSPRLVSQLAWPEVLGRAEVLGREARPSLVHLAALVVTPSWQPLALQQPPLSAGLCLPAHCSAALRAHPPNHHRAAGWELLHCPAAPCCLHGKLLPVGLLLLSGQRQQKVAAGWRGGPAAAGPAARAEAGPTSCPGPVRSGCWAAGWQQAGAAHPPPCLAGRLWTGVASRGMPPAGRPPQRSSAHAWGRCRAAQLQGLAHQAQSWPRRRPLPRPQRPARAAAPSARHSAGRGPAAQCAIMWLQDGRRSSQLRP